MDSVNQRSLYSLEKDIVNLLVDKMESSELSLERASLIAKFVLTQLPSNITEEQLIRILPSLDDEFIELADIVNKYMNEYEVKYKEKLTQEVELLKNTGKFDEAIILINEYFHKKQI